MKHLTLHTWFVCLICISVIFATNAHPSSTAVASKWALNKLLNRTNENSKTEDADLKTQQEVQREGTTSSLSQPSRTTSEKARGSPISPRSRIASDGAGRQRINNPQTGPLFHSRGEENDMMDPGMFMNPCALWGMQWANAYPRSTRSAPWNMWYRMNPMLSFWNQYARSLANGNGYGYGEQYPNYEYPGRYSRLNNGRYGSSRYASYPELESQEETYQQPAASSYYRNQLPESSSRPYNRSQRPPQPAQPYYRNQREEENAHQSVSGTGRVSQNYRQQYTQASEPPRNNAPEERGYREQFTQALERPRNNAPAERGHREQSTQASERPLNNAPAERGHREQSTQASERPRNNASAERGYRESSANAKKSETSLPFTLLYYDDPPQSPTSSEHGNQRTQSNGQREQNEDR